MSNPKDPTHPARRLRRPQRRSQAVPVATVHGLLLINKPPGMTSHDVVQAVRHTVGFRRVGHLGTLDPIARGVLPLALGYATRMAKYLVHADKAYRATFRLGIETDTHDRAGTITREVAVPGELTRAQINAELAAFRGPIDQIPPQISAKKYKGKPLYYWVRKGVAIPEPEPRRVHFHHLEVLAFDSPYLTLEIHCSAGAYIRGLARDLGRRLGCGAIVHEIERTRWGRFTLADTIPLEAFQQQPGYRGPAFISLADIAPDWPILQATPQTIARLFSGQPVPLKPLMRAVEPAEGLLNAAYLRVITNDGVLAAIARIDYPDRLCPELNFPQLVTTAAGNQSKTS